MSRFGVILLIFVALVACEALPAAACPADKSFVPRWGCVLKSEISKAKKICRGVAAAVGHPVPFTECLCRDGRSIGACGD